MRLLWLLTLVTLLMGCDGGVQRVTVMPASAYRIDGDFHFERREILRIVSAVLESNGFVSEAPREEHYGGPEIVQQWAIGNQGYAGTGWVRVLVRAAPERELRVDILSFPAWEYPVASKVRRELTNQLRDCLSDRRIRN